MAHLLVRFEDGWANLYTLPADPYERTADMIALKRSIEGSYYAGEPWGETFYVPERGPIVPCRIGGSQTPYDEDDYATAITKFYAATERSDDDLVAVVTRRVDGRA